MDLRSAGWIADLLERIAGCGLRIEAEAGRPHHEHRRRFAVPGPPKELGIHACYYTNADAR